MERTRFWLVTALVFAAVAVLAGCGGQRDPVDAGGPLEDEPQADHGVKVHGNWTIDIVNPDGTLASHHTFENDLNVNGDLALAQFLSRNKAVGLWWVVIGSNTTSRRPCDIPGPTSNPADCIIAEAADTVPAQPRYSQNLDVSLVGETVVLSGSVTAERNVPLLHHVRTHVGQCEPSVSPDSCFESNTTGFTIADITSEGISVTVGQQMQVTVTLSFS